MFWHRGDTGRRAGTATISSATVFTRAVRGGEVHGVCRPLHSGRSTTVVQTDLSGQDGQRVAQVQAVLGRPAED
jgi:acyl-coenzyme A thioesterase PaaI-like protein